MKMKITPYFLMCFSVLLFISCSKSDDAPVTPDAVDPIEEEIDPEPEEVPDSVNEVIIDMIEYSLVPANGSGITGKATFTRDSNDNTTIIIELENTTTEEHPAYIRFNSAEEGGIVAITLTVCECSIGTTVVTQLDDGTPIDFDGLLVLDGHVSIKESPTESDAVVATANIGLNAN